MIMLIAADVVDHVDGEPVTDDFLQMAMVRPGAHPQYFGDVQLVPARGDVRWKIRMYNEKGFRVSHDVPHDSRHSELLQEVISSIAPSILLIEKHLLPDFSGICERARIPYTVRPYAGELKTNYNRTFPREKMA